MLDAYGKELNDVFNEIYASVQRVEEKMLKDSRLDLSISELDIVETIGKHGDEGCSISAIAKEKNVTLPSITVAIQKLESKDYVEKVRCKEDGRKVFVHLTRRGKKVEAVHRYFHEQLIRSFLREINEENKTEILAALKNLSAFLKKNIEK